jgi:hypothetical protein
MQASRCATVLGAVLLCGAVAAGCGSPATKAVSKPLPFSKDVLLVGTYNGKRGGYTTIQAAVNAARPGDWILVGPGDYHETTDYQRPPTATEANEGWMGGVLIETPDLHLRGMDRNTVIVDGTKAGAPRPCASAPAYQQFGMTGADGKAYGRDGILIWKADNVSVDNMTICNFLAGTGASGNEIWWNGGAESEKIGLQGYEGSYLTATSTYFGNETTAAEYGIFSSNSAGPGSWNQLYANNFNDSGMYVGACQQECDMTISNAWMENNALGFSGSNSGGQIIIEHSQFDHNEDGLDTNTQIAGDPPAPQNGDCPNGGTSPITRTHSCWVFIDNYVHDNNSASMPRAGSAAAGPTGTGMTVSGGRNDTVMGNRFVDNGAWGILFVPYPDDSVPQDGQTCKGTGGVETGPPLGCIYDPEGDALVDNTFVNDGFFDNPSNSDFGQLVLDRGQPQNCFAGNVDPQGSAPADLEKVQPTCGAITTTVNIDAVLLGQVLCDTGFGSCPAGAKYPQPASKVLMTSVPSGLPTMPNPCAGVPNDLWCPSGITGSDPPAHGANSGLPWGTPAAAGGLGFVTTVAARHTRRGNR